MAPGRAKPEARKARPRLEGRSELLDLGFLELDVLASARVVLLEAQLLGLGPRILLRDVEEASVGGADELDLDGCRLGHRKSPKCLKNKKRPCAARSATLCFVGAKLSS